MANELRLKKQEREGIYGEINNFNIRQRMLFGQDKNNRQARNI